MASPPILPSGEAPGLGWLYADFNAYFASVEQQERPELRGRPVAVVQVMAPTTVCIAASYQAKPFGVKTGVRVREAQRMCPQLELILARPKLYVEYHHRLLAAIETVLPIEEVLSIDEAACRLTGSQRSPGRARALALAVKAAVRGVGDTLTCSIGLAPSRYLAKVASDMRKPDGLTLLLRPELPQALYGLGLRDLPGVGPRTERRLRAHGVHTVEQLCAFDRAALSQLWGGVWGGRMWHWLRGDDLDVPSSGRHRLGRQHVLAPAQRNRAGALAVARQLLDSAAAEMRHQRQWTHGLEVAVKFAGGAHAWRLARRLGGCRDSFVLQDLLGRLWRNCPREPPFMVSISLLDVTGEEGRSPGLFESPSASGRASEVMDQLNRRFGSGTLYPASLHATRASSRRGIAFRKVPDLNQL